MTTKPHSSQPAAASQGAEAHTDVVLAEETIVEDLLWDQVAEALDALAAAWEAHLERGAPEPHLADLAPLGDGERRRLTLVELVKADLEYRWQKKRAPRRLEEYLELFPELGTVSKLPVELLHEELQVRMQAGNPVTEAEIHERFPHQADSLCELMGGMAVNGTPTWAYFADTVEPDENATRIESLVPKQRRFVPGERVDDFELLTTLGSGSFAEVFLARQVSMERLVALKISSHKGSEPQTLAQLDHPNIVRVYDLRKCGDSPKLLLYMEVVPGGTLLEVVQRVHRAEKSERTGQLLLDAVDHKLGASGAAVPQSSSIRHWFAESSWPMAVCELGAQLAEGLDYAHQKGVMHRDIKPANVLLTPEGIPKLADFNVSYNGGLDDDIPEDTCGGSLAYMSPEQLQACHPLLGGSPQLVRGASDVYSLGLLMWELLCGARPFPDEPRDESGELARIQRMIDRSHYVDFNTLCQQLPPDCPESLRQVLVRCLQPRKDERYQSAGEVARALRLCLNPQTWKLMQAPRNPLVRAANSFPWLSIVIAGLVPNAVAGRFNLLYNRYRITDAFTPELLERFESLQRQVNGVVFPLGVLVGLWYAIKVRKSIYSNKPEVAAEGSSRMLRFGVFVSLLTVALWSISGLIFPVVLNLSTPEASSVDFYVHFFMSLVICGIVAMAYPYFLLTAIAVRCYVPALMRNNIIAGPQWGDFQHLRGLNHWYLFLTSVVPLLGMVMVVLSGVEHSWASWALLIAGVGGGIGAFAMFRLERLIERNIMALEKTAVDAPRRGGV